MELLLLLFYVLAGFIDCYYKEGEKEVLRRLYPGDEHLQWAMLPSKYHHSNFWHLRIISIWFFPILGFTLYDWHYVIFFVPFYLEDFFYYVFAKQMFNQKMPEKLDWLYGEMKFYEYLLENIFQTNNFTSTMFYKVLSIQFLLFVFLWWWLF